MTDTTVPARLWLAHHGPEHTERCVHWGNQAICRRCAVLYPTAILTSLLVVAVAPPTAALVAAMWLLPVPMVIDWSAEHLGWLPYSPRRQVAVTAVGAPALGIAFAVNALAPWSLTALAPMLTWGLICALVAAAAWYRKAPDEDAGWEERHLDEERARDERLTRLLSAADTETATTTYR